LPATRVLFVPVSGGAGSGEVQRCRLLAQALQARAGGGDGPASDVPAVEVPAVEVPAVEVPAVEMHFLLAPGIDAGAFPATFLSASPTRVPQEVAASIRALQPALVVFDGNARVAALAAARDAGARTLLISSRPSARDRGWRGRRMARLDAHWLIGAELRGAPGWRERLARWRYPRVDVRRFATLFAPPAAVAPVLARFGLQAGDVYAVVCAGGGGHRSPGIFSEAATALARDGITTIAVGMEAAAPAITVPALSNAELMALLAASRVALLAGGSLLVQALALNVAAIALPLQAEQAARVRWLATAGAVRTPSLRSTSTPAVGDAAGVAQLVRDLANDADVRAGLRAGIRALDLRNGLDEAVEALVKLAGGRGCSGAAAR
jgi:hypothetical protein